MPDAEHQQGVNPTESSSPEAIDRAPLNSLVSPPIPSARRASKRRFDPSLQKECWVSRSKIEMFVECQRCFYLDVRLGFSRPKSFPLSINNEIDRRLKEEFDVYRQRGEPHPYMIKAGINAVPFKHENIDAWRDALHRGIRYRVPGTTLVVGGGIDDVWESRGENKGQLIVVDYKATSQAAPATLDDEWKISYKRQAEIYQWLFRMNGFDVSDTALFLFCNARKNTDVFNSKLDFEVTIVPYKGDTSWVESKILNAFNVLRSDEIPAPNGCCDYCRFAAQAGRI
jgi:hypothetical protein